MVNRRHWELARGRDLQGVCIGAKKLLGGHVIVKVGLFCLHRTMANANETIGGVYICADNNGTQKCEDNSRICMQDATMGSDQSGEVKLAMWTGNFVGCWRHENCFSWSVLLNTACYEKPQWNFLSFQIGVLQLPSDRRSATTGWTCTRLISMTWANYPVNYRESKSEPL